MEKLYYSIGEVAGILGENVSFVRYWSNTMDRIVKPHRNAKGNRQYTAKDIETLKQVYYLSKKKGMSLDGAVNQILSERSEVDRNVKVLDSLKAIRSQLVEIKKGL